MRSFAIGLLLLAFQAACSPTTTEPQVIDFETTLSMDVTYPALGDEYNPYLREIGITSYGFSETELTAFKGLEICRRSSLKPNLMEVVVETDTGRRFTFPVTGDGSDQNDASYACNKNDAARFARLFKNIKDDPRLSYAPFSIRERAQIIVDRVEPCPNFEECGEIIPDMMAFEGDCSMDNLEDCEMRPVREMHIVLEEKVSEIATEDLNAVRELRLCPRAYMAEPTRYIMTIIPDIGQRWQMDIPESSLYGCRMKDVEIIAYLLETYGFPEN